METIYYIVLGLLALFLIGPTLFGNSTPIPETSGNVHKITQSSELDALLASTTYVIVDFYADWCPPCRAIAPIFSKLADDHADKDRLAFAKVNVDHVKDIAGRYTVTAMPTFVFFEHGQPKPVATQSSNGEKSNQGALVDRIRGANVQALTAVVLALSYKAKAARTQAKPPSE